MHLCLTEFQMRTLLEEFEIAHPALPSDLQGLSILHLSDFHLRGPWRRFGVLVEMLEVVSRRAVDLVCLTGDTVEQLGVEDEAMDLLTQITRQSCPRLGVFGIHGNHDPPALIARASTIPGIRWLLNETVAVGGFEITGMSEPEDPLSAVLGAPAKASEGGGRPFRLGLAHEPTNIVPAAAMGIDVLLAGHTHGGQMRLSARFAPHTSCDLKPTAASGLIRCGPSVCCISRGLGQTVWPWRFRCPPQVGLYRLGWGELSGTGVGIERLRAW
ncbi:MAG: metallophosphoesterase [Phycisphaerales bacterium]|nr:metallophosphoesterase [Phycisphaerales bacterium]